MKKYSKEDFALVVEAIRQEYKNNPINLPETNSLLLLAFQYKPAEPSLLDMAQTTALAKDPSGTRILFDPTQHTELNKISNDNIESIIYWLGLGEKVVKDISPGSHLYSRPGTIPMFTRHDPYRFSLVVSDSFDNWYAAFQQRKNRTLKDLAQQHIKNIYRMVTLIDERLQLNNTPEITLPLTPSIGYAPVLKKSRQEILDYLEEEDIIFGFYIRPYPDGDLIIEVNIDKFYKFKPEIEKVYAAIPGNENTKQPSSIALPPGTQWENITIKFLDGHNVSIKTGNLKIEKNYKEMGFEDKKKRLPNQQWDFLKLLAKYTGTLTWKDSEARDSLKKKKQLLSQALKHYFNIDTDPFLPYKQEKAYKIRINLIAE